MVSDKTLKDVENVAKWQREEAVRLSATVVDPRKLILEVLAARLESGRLTVDELRESGYPLDFIHDARDLAFSLRRMMQEIRWG